MLDHLKSTNDYSLFFQEVNNVNRTEGLDEETSHDDNSTEDVTPPTVRKVLQTLQTIQGTPSLRTPTAVNIVGHEDDPVESPSNHVHVLRLYHRMKLDGNTTSGGTKKVHPLYPTVWKF